MYTVTAMIESFLRRLSYAEVTFARIGKHRGHELARRELGRDRGGREGGGPRRDSDQEPLLASQPSGPRQRVLVTDLDDPVDDLAVEHARNERRADALDGVGARLAAGQHGRARRLHGDHLHTGHLLLEDLTHTGQRPARADAGHDGEPDARIAAGGSTSVPPGFSAPPRSASSTMATAMRSLTLPPGFNDSTFAITVAPPGCGRRLRRTMGVCPMSSRTLAAIGGRPTAGASSDVVHRTGGALALAHAFGQLAEREPVDHARHGLGDLVPQLHQVLTITAAPAITSGFERATGALDGTKDGAHGDRFRRTSQMVTPGGPPFRGEQPRALEREQHLFQVALGDGLPRRDLLDGDETTSVVQGQVEHRLDRVLALGRDPHAASGRHTSRPSASRRAASRAK